MFNNDEHYLKQTYGTNDHFIVPEGYFDSLSERVMQKIENGSYADREIIYRQPLPLSAKKVSLWSRYRRTVVSVAAAVCAAIFSLGGYLRYASHQSYDSSEVQEKTASHAIETYNLNAMVDYTMMDTEDMYAYMADAK